MSQTPMTRTWDGLAIAEDDPTGVTVVVRRPGPAGEHEFLLLHRAHHGAEYDGDWAWTSPAGCRQPGEPVYAAARRELAEEAGLKDVEPWPVDLSWRAPHGDRWAFFALDVASDTTVELVDPEHDRFEWLPGAEALRRVLPRLVAAAQFQRVEHIPNATLSFRPLTYDDMPNVVRWQSQPHVARWWHREVTTVAEALDRYGPSLTGQEPTRSWVVTLDGRDVGYLQDYRVGDYEEYASATGFTDAVGFDYLIGEPQLTGRGLGTRMIWEFLRDVVAPAYPDAPTFLASPDPDNATSLRALAKCGFAIGPCVGVRDEGKITREVVCTLDRRHWFGPSSVPG